MPLGKNNTDLNATGTSYRNGTPVTLPVDFGNDITLPHEFGNPVPTSGTEQNVVNWQTPDPTHFGNEIGGSTPPSGIALVAATAVEEQHVINLTTSAINTTGADFLVVSTANNAGLSAPTTSMSDSFRNVWVPLNSYGFGSGSSSEQMWYCANPIVGPDHTFTFTNPSGVGSTGVAAAAFSGVSSSPFEAGSDSGGTAIGTTVQPGSVTALSTGDLFITGLNTLCTNPANVTVDSGFIIAAIAQTGTGDATSIAYLIATSPSQTENPTWASDFFFAMVAQIAVFAAA